MWLIKKERKKEDVNKGINSEPRCEHWYGQLHIFMSISLNKGLGIALNIVKKIGLHINVKICLNIA